MKAKPAGMSWAAWARANGMNPTTAGKIGLIPMEEATRYALGMGQEAPEPAPEKTWTPPVKRDAPPAPKTRRGCQHWTHEEEKQLVNMIRAGQSQAAIAEKMGRSESSVNHRVRELGLNGKFHAKRVRKLLAKRKSAAKWIGWGRDEDDALLDAKRAGYTYAQIADLLPGRSPESVKKRYARLMNWCD